jgi:hypothetical protein
MKIIFMLRIPYQLPCIVAYGTLVYGSYIVLLEFLHLLLRSSLGHIISSSSLLVPSSEDRKVITTTPLILGSLIIE